MRLSVLDQSPVIGGHFAARAIEETSALARRADQLGYHRYWLAEHHAIAALADPCPAVLLARLGAETTRIRDGRRAEMRAALKRSAAVASRTRSVSRSDYASRRRSYERLIGAF